MRTEFRNKFTGETLSTYPTAFAALSGKPPRAMNEDRLKKQEEKFASRYICPICKQPRTWIPDTNIMACKNESCKGFPVKDAEGNIVRYAPSFSRLNEKGAIIAQKIYGTKGEK